MLPRGFPLFLLIAWPGLRLPLPAFQSPWPSSPLTYQARDPTNMACGACMTPPPHSPRAVYPTPPPFCMNARWQGFARSNLRGSGRWGSTYRGVLGGTPVAITCLKPENMEVRGRAGQGRVGQQADIRSGGEGTLR